MPQRRNLPPDVAALKRQLTRHGKVGYSNFKTTATALREETRGRVAGQSADLIRETRDSR
jgi:hypothetical protein